jgi:hypothetical protein
MASTIVQFVAYENQSLTAFLAGREGATGTPAGSYACSEVDSGQYQFTVIEDLVGEFDLEVKDASGELAVRQYVNLQDDTEIYPGYNFSKAELVGGDATAANQAILQTAINQLKAKFDLIQG